MCFTADEICSAFGTDAEWGVRALNTKSTITSTMGTGTGTGSHPRAWTA